MKKMKTTKFYIKGEKVTKNVFKMIVRDLKDIDKGLGNNKNMNIFSLLSFSSFL